MTSLTSDVSDSALRAVKTLGDRLGIDGEDLLRVWYFETWFKPLNPESFGGADYWGPASVDGQYLPVSREEFRPLSLEQRVPLMQGLLETQIRFNGGVAPKDYGVLYALNIMPARAGAGGPNGPDSRLLIERDGNYWSNQSNLLRQYADPEGVTIGSVRRSLDAQRSEPRLMELVARYRQVSGSSFKGALSKAAPALVAVGLTLAALYVLFPQQRSRALARLSF